MGSAASAREFSPLGSNMPSEGRRAPSSRKAAVAGAIVMAQLALVAMLAFMASPEAYSATEIAESVDHQHMSAADVKEYHEMQKEMSGMNMEGMAGMKDNKKEDVQEHHSDLTESNEYT